MHADGRCALVRETASARDTNTCDSACSTQSVSPDEGCFCRRSHNVNASSRTSLIAAPTNVCSTFADSLAALVSASPLVLSNKNVKIDMYMWTI